MNILLLGAPGSGKGTIANLLVKKLSLLKVSTGDILRDNVSRKTELGKKAQNYMNSGNLVPDDLVIQMFQQFFKSSDLSKGFILDGFPRTLTQATILSEILGSENIRLDAAVRIEVDDVEIIRRITNRRTCKNCQAIYSCTYNPSKVDGVCDDCHGQLVVRSDETEKVIQNRLEVYRRQTEPIISYYNDKHLLKSYKHPDSNVIADMIISDHHIV